MIDVEKATKKELLKEWDNVTDLWGGYSCDCLGFYVDALHKEISKRGGWPVRKRKLIENE